MSRVGGASSGKVETTSLPLPSGASTLSEQQVQTALLTTASGINGNKVTIGITAVELTFTGTTKGISIQADHENTNFIWIGGSSVDGNGSNAFAMLSAGQSISIDFDDSAVPLYAISDATGQSIYKVALT